MASLSELVNAAQVTQQAQNQNPLAKVAESALSGGFTGMALRRQDQKDSMDRYVKLLDVQEKLAKIDTERLNQRITSNVAKSVGVLPMDSGEAMNARAVASDAMIPADDVPVVNTQQGKLARLMKGQRLAGFSLSGGKVDFQFKGPREAADRDPAARREKIMKLATDAAQREWDQSQMPKAMPGQTSFGRPPNDVVKKYLRAMTAYVDGDTATYDEEMKKVGDPLGIGGAGGDLNLDLGGK